MISEVEAIPIDGFVIQTHGLNNALRETHVLAAPNEISEKGVEVVFSQCCVRIIQRPTTAFVP